MRETSSLELLAATGLHELLAASAAHAHFAHFDHSALLATA